MNTKKCSKCKEYKILDEFHKRKISNDGYQNVCQICKYSQVKVHYRTKKGLITKIYKSQKLSSKKRGHNPPVYTIEELKLWIISQHNFETLYENWVNSDYEKNLSPSVDRLDDYKGYTLDRLQLMTWGENKEKGHKDRVDGINNKRSKSVIQMDLDGNFIKEFYSMHQAERKTIAKISNIHKVCNGLRNNAGGFIWKYKHNN